MNTEQVIRLLGDKNIKIVNEGNKIFYDERIKNDIPLQNHYAILENGNKWVIGLVKVERVNIPEFTIENTFSCKEEALTYFFLFLLRKYYLNQYVYPARDRSISEWDINVILDVMKRNNIPQKYLSYNNIHNENSAYYYEHDGEWFRGYIGHSGELVAKNENGFNQEEKNWFLSLSLNDLYPLYLLDQYEQVLLEKQEIVRPFSDIERAQFLGYRL